MLPVLVLALGYIFYKIVIKREISDWRETTGPVGFFLIIWVIIILLITSL